MDMKEFLMEGGRISFPYKRNEKEWVGEVKLYIFAGYFSEPKIIFEGGHERKEFILENADLAVQTYKDYVFNPTNLMYKMNPAVIKAMGSTYNEIDLDNKEDFEKVAKIRRELISTANPKK